MATHAISIGHDHHLTAETVDLVARNPKIKVALSVKGRARILESRAVIERMVEQGKVVYGVTTGFGSFKDKFIAHDDVAELQRNLLRSHSAGVGPFLAPEMVRATMVVRLNSLSQGYSGVRLELLELLVELLNRNVIPQVPSQGSVGSSGDLAPLSHMGLVLMGEGKAWYKGELLPGKRALKLAGLKPIQFAAKEGLAWNNGTSVMTGIAALALVRARQLTAAADIVLALTLEALRGMPGAFDRRVHAIRPHPGQGIVAERVRRFTAGSKLINAAPGHVQDAYSLRCSPQVHGAIRDALEYVGGVVDRELNSVTDNPLIFTSPDAAISGGNFHGEPIAIAMDVLGIALAELGDISERRTAKLIDPGTNDGLPAYLIGAEKGGLHNGFMIPQYVAAALVSENKVLAHPASVDSIPTSANQEDHVSMGTIAARKGWSIAENVSNVIAIELMNATQAVEFRGVSKLGTKTRAAHRLVRTVVKKLVDDRELASDITRIRDLISTPTFQTLVR